MAAAKHPSGHRLLLPDNPIESPPQDCLRRAPLAKRVASVIASFEGAESFVIGIEGPWGSGKTSFLNLVTSHFSDSDGPLIVRFNPWTFDDQNELVSDLFASIASAVRANVEESGPEKIRTYASRLKRGARFSFAPEVSFMGMKLKAGHTEQTHDLRPALQLREEVDALLMTLPRKLLIVIDDIDRLDKLETRGVLKLVKMTANFPNTIFLLAYDRQRVTEQLDDQGFSGDDYLKKIVQVSFILPQVEREDLLRVLFSDLEQTTKQLYGDMELEGEDKRRWNRIFDSGFKFLFQTLRDVKRFISSLRLDWSIVGADDVNMTDFIAIEAIRVFYPRMYSAIASRSWLFAGIQLESMDRAATKEARQKEYETLLQLVPEGEQSHIRGICDELFPPLHQDFLSSGEQERQWRRGRRICSTDRFGFYFQLGLPTGGVSETEIQIIIKSAANDKLLRSRLLQLRKENKFRTALAKLHDHLGTFDRSGLANLVLALWDLEGELDDSEPTAFNEDPLRGAVTSLVYEATRDCIPEDERQEFLLQAISSSTTLSFPAMLCSKLLDEQATDPYNGPPPLVSQEVAMMLRDTMQTRIEQAAAEHRLETEGYFAFLLFCWKGWGKAEGMKQYLDSLLHEPSGVALLLRSFVTVAYTGEGPQRVMNKDSLGKIVPTEEVENAVSRVTEGQLEELSPDQQEAISLFRTGRTPNSV